MKKIKVLALCAIAAGFVISCQKNDTIEEVQPETSTEISKEDQIALAKAGVNPLAATYQTLTHPDGTTVKGIMGGSEGFQDIFIALDDLANQALPSSPDNVKQYRTNNLVRRNSTIDVIGYTGSGFALTQRMRTGLQWAVNNYNRINTSLTFRLTFTASTNGDMVIYNAGGSGAGGSAEFPSGGNPGKFIRILGGMASQNNNVNEHVIGHEMGHALGFRHTDYARRRCDGSNEGTAGSIGAINIPGTPTANRWGQNGLDSGSLMISCFDGSEDGEFSRFDIIALEELY